MSLSKIYAAAVQGLDVALITLEVNVGQGTKFFMVGLPDNAVKESQQRVESALKYHGYHMPRQKVVINLAPASLRKEGAAYDLPLAIGILQASNQLAIPDLEKHAFMGELSLDGQLRPIKGALPIAIEIRKQKFKSLVLPKGNALEAAVVNDLEIIGANSLEEVVAHFCKNKKIAPTILNTREIFFKKQQENTEDLNEIRGHQQSKRALEIAAAGGHNLLMIGPPGSEKTMLSQRLPSILPPLSLEEALDVTRIHSVAGQLIPNQGLITTRPFRAPHHTISHVALVGGGTIPQPGEISLAHNGVLFLDELPEFQRPTLEALRQPLESRSITISRTKMSFSYPANFVLIASMNPCPCGYYTHPTKDCTCSAQNIQKYLNRISGPLLDRIDLHIEVNSLPFNELHTTKKEPSSEQIRTRVIQARERQQHRFAKEPGTYHNAMMPAKLVQKICKINTKGSELLKRAMEQLGLSNRSYERILKVSRTLADLGDATEITPAHLAEAIQLRSFDKTTRLASP